MNYVDKSGTSQNNSEIVPTTYPQPNQFLINLTQIGTDPRIAGVKTQIDPTKGGFK